METLEQLKEIIKNAPDGATHYDEEGDYIKLSDEFIFWYDEFEWSELETYVVMRSLSDIKQIIELMEWKEKAYQAYTSLEEVKQKYNGQNKIAKELLKLAYECDEFALPGDLRKDIKEFLDNL